MDRLVSLVLLSLIGVAGCGPDEPDLSGRFRSTDYVCFGQAPEEETVEIAQSGRDIVATKIVGDPCVPAGEVSFRGRLSGVDSGKVECVSGEPGKPSSGAFDDTILIESPDTFTACGWTFERVQ